MFVGLCSVLKPYSDLQGTYAVSCPVRLRTPILLITYLTLAGLEQFVILEERGGKKNFDLIPYSMDQVTCFSWDSKQAGVVVT